MSKTLAYLLVAWLLGLGCGNESGGAAAAKPGELQKPAKLTTASSSRSFVMRYTATISNVPADAKQLDLWLPVPSSDAQQTIDQVQVESSLPHEIVVEPEYGNRVLHLWSDHPAPTSATLVFNCTRYDEHALGSAPSHVSAGPEPTDRLLQPDRLGVIDAHIQSLADQITAGKTDTLAKARAIYDYVIDHMAYDKKAPGWGNGDTLRACDIGKGNCTDFHALFISLARASQIPSRFGIGFQVPIDHPRGPITGYHCWAESWLPGSGWVPVDASEAWKDQTRHEFYFGSLDDNRIRMSIGRDLSLPGMHGKPLNYFLSPYLEVDGKSMAVEKSVSFSTRSESK